MSDTRKMVNVRLNASQSYQKIDGFGLNINSQHWSEQLIPTMDLLREDLGATLYRVDIWGKSDWIDPTGELGREKALSPENMAAVYTGETFRKGWAMMHYLNQHGIQPYLTASGDVPPWMLGSTYRPEYLASIADIPPDLLGTGRPLVDYEAFCDMMVSMIDWARHKEGLKFNLFGPLNESDIAQPEGPGVDPVEFVKVCELLVDKLDRKGLPDIRLVVAEQSTFGPWYLEQLVRSRRLDGRIGVFGLHDYSDIPPETYQGVTSVVQESAYAGVPLWMTEYGDLEQTGEKEWYVGWASTSRLFDQLEAGFSAALIWDAYDNYHDHNEHWTIYGVLRTGLGAYTPKKRYYAAKQVFRFVPAGFERIQVSADSPDLRVLAFADPARTDFTLVGMNLSNRNIYLNAITEGLAEENQHRKVTYYRTSETENCYTIGQIPRHVSFFGDVEVMVPAESIFTLTTMKVG